LSIVFKVSVRRRLGGKVQLEVEAFRRLGKWSKVTLCRRWRQLQGKAPEATYRGRGRLQQRRLGGGGCRGRLHWWLLLQGKGKPSGGTRRSGGGGRRRGWLRWRRQKKGAVVPSASMGRSGSGSGIMEVGGKSSHILYQGSMVRWGFLFYGPQANNSGPIL
jgi:hypothetical protein